MLTLWIAGLAQPSVGTIPDLIALGMGAYIVRGWLWVSSHSLEGPDIPYRLLVCTYCLVDMVRKYSHTLVCGPTALMATLASDPVGRELFEYWHYEDLNSGCPASVEDLFDAPWQDGPLFYALHGVRGPPCG